MDCVPSWSMVIKWWYRTNSERPLDFEVVAPCQASSHPSHPLRSVLLNLYVLHVLNYEDQNSSIRNLCPFGRFLYSSASSRFSNNCSVTAFYTIPTVSIGSQCCRPRRARYSRWHMLCPSSHVIHTVTLYERKCTEDVFRMPSVNTLIAMFILKSDTGWQTDFIIQQSRQSFNYDW